MNSTRKYKILLSFYNTHQIGGPSTAMSRLMNSKLSEKYDFAPITINERLGKIPRISVICKLVMEIKKEKPDVIYFTGLQLHGFYMALSAAVAGYKKRTIMVVRGSSCDAMNISKCSLFLFRNFVEPITCKLTEITHTVCLEIANNPIVKNNINIFGGVIHNAAPQLTKIYERESFRSEIGVTDDEILLVYTGRIVEDKGIHILIQAMKKQNFHIKLLLVGDGQIEKYKEMCKILEVSENVYFLGRRSDVFSILVASDIFVFPTFHENLSNSVLEACSIGLPVIATNIGGNPEIIRNGIEGILIPANNVEKLADAIQTLAEADELRKMMGKNAKKRMLEEFSQKIIYGSIEKLFDRIIHNN